MLFGLPVTKTEARKISNSDIQNGYMTLTITQKKRWLRAASAVDGCIRLSQPPDPSAIQICIFNPNTQAYDALCWLDRDPFDLV
jgi:hypothetical protein